MKNGTGFGVLSENRRKARMIGESRRAGISLPVATRQLGASLAKNQESLEKIGKNGVFRHAAARRVLGVAKPQNRKTVKSEK
jgi:hypothetical protein